jgi:hypothetical protein
MVDRETIHAVHVGDQAELLSRLGLTEAYERGELRCRTCQRPVKDHGLGILRMTQAAEIEVACAEAACTRPKRGAE